MLTNIDIPDMKLPETRKMSTQSKHSECTKRENYLGSILQPVAVGSENNWNGRHTSG